MSSTKERIIVILLVVALLFSFASLTLHFVSFSGGVYSGGANGASGESGQVNLFVQHNAAGQSASGSG